MKENLEKARIMAVNFHGAQKYGEKPYEVHLQSVVNVLERFGFDLSDEKNEPLLVSAWLHDALEDTELTKNEIENQFGLEVADLVWRVTDEEGANRKERKEKTYLKIRESENAMILKLADRIANVESSRQSNKSLLKMYQKEQAKFSESLKPYSKTSNALSMWQYLEEKLNDE